VAKTASTSVCDCIVIRTDSAEVIQPLPVDAIQLHNGNYTPTYKPGNH
jgi:hypothetical protein